MSRYQWWGREFSMVFMPHAEYLDWFPRGFYVLPSELAWLIREMDAGRLNRACAVKAFEKSWESRRKLAARG